MDCKFVIGQRVVCVEDNWCLSKEQLLTGVGEYLKSVPYKGQILTIRDMIVIDRWVYLWFEEIRNPEMPPDMIVDKRIHEINFWSGHFRPVKETKLDCFQKLLNPTPTKDLERVS